MAIHYNLAKVYAISDDDDDFVRQIITLFVEEVPSDIKQIKEGIEDKDYVKTYGFAHKTKPTLDLLGMDAAKEEILLVEQWTRDQGKKKEIKEVYKSLKNRINAALEEVKKDFNL
ncbi:histidine kinase [Flavobacterium columnare]|uniref:Two-component system phosphotransfer protein (HPt) n=2 Tax=Flavobacterium columnare TaxID=996 RepID=G8X8Y5_FLACA|nr:Hpt domain-containing protein [Flavobacterium columnare]AEW87218.1 putative two-component system phosphotransfer protein (HPt) [Flavobacterium columnare ATCC 49512]AMO19128.1 Hpt domain-containing protein [Flavobacterium columnare]ANO48069.1 putative two-component system phosphotransfer protein (HPt) [Flavobacterium columnare]APT21358.1 histidine kinase [Flavobacterium columnare]AUX17070.1 histidine kinase [Flavobacterium columnare]